MPELQFTKKTQVRVLSWKFWEILHSSHFSEHPSGDWPLTLKEVMYDMGQGVQK